MSSIDMHNIAVSHSRNGIIQNQNQSLSIPLAQQSDNGTQLSLSGSLAQQSFNETRLSTDLNTSTDITDDTSSTLIHTLDQDINGVDNSSDVSVNPHQSK